jgi:hypothetical protein
LTEAAPWQDGSNLTGFSIERCYKGFFQMCGPLQFAAFSFQPEASSYCKASGEAP